MFRLKINVTKDVLQRSMLCGTDSRLITENCAVAVAIKDLFPSAYVCKTTIGFDYKPNLIIDLPHIAQEFIESFDCFKDNPKVRLTMEPISFEIDVPDEAIDMITIDELHEVLEHSSTMSLA